LKRPCSRVGGAIPVPGFGPKLFVTQIGPDHEGSFDLYASEVLPRYA